MRNLLISFFFFFFFAVAKKTQFLLKFLNGVGGIKKIDFLLAWVCVGVMPKNTFRLPELLFALSLYLIGYLKIIFNFVSLVKNNFQRLPRRAYGTARNDGKGFRLPEN